MSLTRPMSYGFIRKSPLTPLCQRGKTDLFPLRKRGIEGDFSKNIFMLLCEPKAHVIDPKMSYNVVIPEVVIGNPFFCKNLDTRRSLSS